MRIGDVSRWHEDSPYESRLHSPDAQYKDLVHADEADGTILKSTLISDYSPETHVDQTERRVAPKMPNFPQAHLVLIFHGAFYIYQHAYRKMFPVASANQRFILFSPLRHGAIQGCRQHLPRPRATQCESCMCFGLWGVKRFVCDGGSLNKRRLQLLKMSGCCTR